MGLARPLAVLVAALPLACRAPAPGNEAPDARTSTASTPGAAGAAGAPQVQLTWRLFEIQHELDDKGVDVQSAVFELLVNGGSPPRLSLGRRSSSACSVHGADAAGAVTTLECRAGSRDEVARVVRSSPGELRVEAYGRDHANPDDAAARTELRSATLAIPAGAEVVVDPGLSRIPDETPTN
jgi:hypothetical protein